MSTEPIGDEIGLCAAQPDIASAEMAESAETVVQRQLDAYNARALDALVAVYADDAQLFEHPSTLTGAGT